MQAELEDCLSAAPEEENIYDDYELFVALASYDGRSLTVWKKAPGGMEERIQLRAPSRHLGKRVAFYEDDLIQITDSSPCFGGWWKGSLNGAVGIFPSCLLEALDTSLPTLDTLEDTMASMDSLMASMSASSSAMVAMMMNTTPRSGEREIDRLADRLEHVADTTIAPDVEEVERIAAVVPEIDDAEEDEATRGPTSALPAGKSLPSRLDVLQEEAAIAEPLKGAVEAESTAREPGKENAVVEVAVKEEVAQGNVGKGTAVDSSPAPSGVAVPISKPLNKSGPRVVRPAALKISKGDGTVVTRALSPPGESTASKKVPSDPTKTAQASQPSNNRAIRTIKVVKAGSGPSISPLRARVSMPRPASASGVLMMRGGVRRPVVVRSASPKNSMTEVVVTGTSPTTTPSALLSPRKKAARPLSPRKPIAVDEDMPLAPPPETGLRSRATLEEDSPLGPPPEDLPLPPTGDETRRVTALEGEGEDDADLEDLPDVEKTLRLPEEPAPLPPPYDPQEIESPRWVPVDRVPVIQKSPRGSRFSLDLTGVSDRMKTVKEDVFQPITPGTRARLHSLPRPDEPAPSCPFDYDPYEDSYGEEGDDNTDHYNDSSDEETPGGSAQKRKVQLVEAMPTASCEAEGETVSTSGEGDSPGSGEGEAPVQLREKTKKRLNQKAQRRQAKGGHQPNRSCSAPSAKEPTELMKAVGASPRVEASAAPQRAYSSVKAEDFANISTEGVQLRPKVKKALGAKKKRRAPQQQQQRPVGAVQRELSPEQGAPKTPAEMRRYNFFEVVATERSYVKAMEQLVQVMAGLLEIQRKLTEAGDTGAALPAELQTLHVSATIILGYSRKTLEMMGPRQQNYDDQTCIGDIFLLVADFLKIYTQYVRGYEPFVNKFLIARQKNKLLREQVEKYEMSVGSFITFESHLIVPVQRIPRYSMLLKDMLKNTHEDHPDYHLLAEAVRKIERVADFVNARQTVYENLNKVIELEKKYGKQLTEQTGISQFVRSHRRVIKEASLYLCAGDSKSRRVQVSLLNDLLVVGTAPRQSTIMNWGGCKLLNVVCLWLVDHKNVTDVAGRQHCFELVMEATSESVLVLKCSSEEEKREWMEELAAVKRMLNKAINVGAKTAEQKKRISIALNVKWTSPVIPQEIAMALAEEQAQRRQQANMQMMPIAQDNTEISRITELPSEITNALRRESNKKSITRRTGRAGSSGDSGSDQDLEERSSRESVQQKQRPERPRSPATAATNADRARSPISSRTKKAKGAAKLKKTLSPLSRHKEGGKSGGGRRASTLRGRERAAAMEERDQDGQTSPRSLKVAKESPASPWSPKMLKLRLSKSKGDKGDERAEARMERRRREEKRREEKEERRREEKEEKKREKKAKEAREATHLALPPDLAPSDLKSGLSPRSEKSSSLLKKVGSKKRIGQSLGRRKGHSRSNSVECRGDEPTPALGLADTRKTRTRRSVSMSDMANEPARLSAAMFSKSTSAVTAAASNASRKGTMPRRRKSKETLTKRKKKKRPKLDLSPDVPNSLTKSS